MVKKKTTTMTKRRTKILSLKKKTREHMIFILLSVRFETKPEITGLSHLFCTVLLRPSLMSGTEKINK